ncbi:MAG: tetratricopeptide repeat protein, partial [Candidatus Puniceispirillales bacterium]
MASDDDKKKAQELVEQAGRLLVSLQNEPEHKTQLANKAIGYLDEAITLDPENDKAWNNRGSAKSDIGDHHGAIADYDKAIRLNPDNDFAWSGRGEAKSRLGDHHGAMADC